MAEWGIRWAVPFPFSQNVSPHNPYWISRKKQTASSLAFAPPLFTLAKAKKSHLTWSIIYTNEPISLVAVGKKELQLVEENHATVKPDSSIAPREMKGAFHSTKISGLTFRNFHMSNGTVFSTTPDRSRSIPAWAHFTRQNAEGSWKSGCFKHRKLLHGTCGKKSSTYSIFLIFTWPTQTPFSPDESNLRTFLVGKYAAREVCKQSELNLRKFGTSSPQIARESDPNVENRKSRTGSNCGSLFCIQCSVDSKTRCGMPCWSFSRLKELGQIHTG